MKLPLFFWFPDRHSIRNLSIEVVSSHLFLRKSYLCELLNICQRQVSNRVAIMALAARGRSLWPTRGRRGTALHSRWRTRHASSSEGAPTVAACVGLFRFGRRIAAADVSIVYAVQTCTYYPSISSISMARRGQPAPGLLRGMTTTFVAPAGLHLHPRWRRPLGWSLPRRAAGATPMPSSPPRLFVSAVAPSADVAGAPPRRRRGRSGGGGSASSQTAAAPRASFAEPAVPRQVARRRRRPPAPPTTIRPSSPALLRSAPAAVPPISEATFPPSIPPVLPCGALLSSPPCATGPCPYLRYRCPRGHIITATPSSPAAVACPGCTYEGLCGAPGRPKHTPASLSALAAGRGGFLLSSVYVNARTPVVWACRAGHAWAATVDNVKRGSWCPVCAREASRAAGLAAARAAAAARGGVCLSEEYVNNKAPLQWRCAVGHQWSAPANNVCRGAGGGRPPSWCPVCARGGGLGRGSMERVKGGMRGRLAEVV